MASGYKISGGVITAKTVGDEMIPGEFKGYASKAPANNAIKGPFAIKTAIILGYKLGSPIRNGGEPPPIEGLYLPLEFCGSLVKRGIATCEEALDYKGPGLALGTVGFEYSGISVESNIGFSGRMGISHSPYLQCGF
jgi:hypothetical protein